MPDDMYPEADSEESNGKKPEIDDGDDTALLSKAFLGGRCKAGDKYEVEVVSELEDEAEVKLVKKDSKPQDEPEKSRMAMAGETLDMMES